MNAFIKFLAVALVTTGSTVAIAAPSPQVQGGGLEPQTFGRPMTHLGMAKPVRFQLTVSSVPCDPGIDACVVMNPPGTRTNYVNQDLTSIVIPANSTHSIVWPVFFQLAQYELYNNTAATQDPALFQINIIMTLDSAALLDPTLINPDTGLPYNGSYQVSFSPAEGENRSMAPGERVLRKIRNASTGNLALDYGFLLGLGLPDSVVKKIFSGQITLHLGLQINARYVDFGVGAFSMRLIGD